MPTIDLISTLLASPGFQRQLKALTVESVRSQFPNLQSDNDLFSAEVYDWKYLLMCGSVLSQSDETTAQSAALRVAHHCLVTTDLDPSMRTAACVTLHTLTNRPAIDLAVKRMLISKDFLSDVPLPLKMDWVHRAVRYSVVLGDNSIINVNRFQRQFWDEVDGNDWLSVSAPTSAGKSFLLLNWLAEYLRDRNKPLVVYVVPTRALIQQVQTDLEDHFALQGPKGTKVSCLPLASQVSATTATVFVLTQERLHILLNNLPQNTAIDLLVVDEAQKVGDGARGVLLQVVLEAVAQLSAKVKIIFASPTTANPELLLDGAPVGVTRKGLRSDQVTVSQNLIWVSPVPHTEVVWAVELCYGGERIPLGVVEVTHRPLSGRKKLAFVAFALGGLAEREGGNLVYVNGAAEAEEVALLLADLVGTSVDTTGDKAVSDLIALSRKTVHKDYRLATVLARGVAFHYGNMPLIIRNEIERLFRENVIRYLVCTSTLVEGVNLPAKSIFVRGPTKGRGQPMGESDFWNLAGRAGRLGKEFQGNVICIDPLDQTAWPEPPPVERKGQLIQRSTDDVLSNSEAFLLYIHGDPSKVEKGRIPEYEHVLGYLFRHVLRFETLKQSPFAGHHSPELVAQLDAALDAVKADLKTPREIIERNPGINPLSMDKLLSYFLSYTKPVQELLPTLPEDANAATALKRIFARINNYIAPNAFGTGNRVMALAILVVNWMRGFSLARIISDRETRYPDKALPATIRGSMEDVEQVARFLAPKYVSCYTDLLRYFLTNAGHAVLAANMPDLTLWMEFGASAETQLSLMSLGLSRTSAIAISEIIADDGLDVEACLLWIEKQDLAVLDLPSLVVREIKRLRGDDFLSA